MAELYLGVVLSMPTRACVIDANGSVRGRGFSTRNIVWDHAGAVQAVAETAAEALSAAQSSLSEARKVCVTFSFPGWGEDFLWHDDLVREALGDVPFITSDHATAAHAAAYGGTDGILVAGYDESQALGLKDGNYARAGCWGDTFGGEGTIHRIMTQGLRMAARYADGRGDKTRMLGEFCALLDCSPRGLIHRIHDKHVSWADLYEIVFRCAESGDRPAAGVVHEEARELVSMARAVAVRLEMVSPRVSVVGRCFDFPLFVEAFRRCLHGELPDASVEQCSRPTVEGAAIMARMEALGESPSD